MRPVRAHAGRLAFAAVDRALGRLQRVVGAEARGADDRSADLGADRSRNHAGADGGGRSRRRAARRVNRVERIGGRPRMRAAELRRHGLAEDDAAGLAQRPDRGIVALRKISREGRAAELRRHVLCLQQVLDADGHAVDLRQRPAAAPTLGAGVGLSARRAFVNRDPSLHDALPRGNRFEATLQISARRVAARFERREVRAELKRGKKVRLVASAHRSCLPWTGRQRRCDDRLSGRSRQAISCARTKKARRLTAGSSV